ncbi:MAG: HupE/UreJ family protein [Pseudomonadota bacterium]
MKTTNALKLIAMTLALTTQALVFGHAMDQSYVFLNVEDNRLSGHVDMTIADINSALGLSMPDDGTATEADVAPHRPAIEAYLRERVSLAVDGGEAGLPLTDWQLADIEIAQYVQSYFAFEDLSQMPKEVAFDYAVLFAERPSHRAMAVIETYWKSGIFGSEHISLVFEPGREKQTLTIDESSVWTGLIAQIRSGIHHIWIGIDHILFLIALLLPAVVVRRDGRWQATASFKDALIHVVKVVTVFTIAHSITLSLAALGVINLSSRLIESIIALSIAVAAFDVLRPIFNRRIWIVVFAFGLFHGFGFASVLGDIGIPASYMVHSLLGFNIGVEIGQLAIVAVAFPLLYLLARLPAYTRFMMPAGAILLIVVSMYWFIERGFGIDLPAGAMLNAVLNLFN